MSLLWLAFGVASTLLIGVNAVVIRYLELAGMPPLTIAVARLYLGAFFIFVFLRLSGKRVSLEVKNKPLFIMVSILGVAANYFFYNLAISMTDASTAILLESTAPIFVIILMSVVFKYAFSLREAAAVFLSFAGVFLIVFSQSTSLVQPTFLGSLLGIAAGLTWALFTAASKRSLQDEDSLVLLFKVFLVSGLFLTPFVLTDLRLPVSGLPWLLFLGLVTTALAYFLYFEVTKRVSAVTASILFCLSPLFAVATSFVFLNEVPSPVVLGGGALILGAVFVSRNN